MYDRGINPTRYEYPVILLKREKKTTRANAEDCTDHNGLGEKGMAYY